MRSLAISLILIAIGYAAQAQTAPPELVTIPAGETLFGATPNDRWAIAREGPRQRVYVPSFRIGRTPVTFAQWDACVAAGGCDGWRPGDRNWGRGERPVIHVGAADAERFIAWARARFGEPYRLPSEQEWERAARAGTAAAFYWGDSVIAGQALCHGCGETPFVHMTAPVGRFPANPFGLHGMAGNVWEWTADCWRETHDAAAMDCARRPLKGGSWYFHAKNARPAARTPGRLDARHYDVGFRVAADIR